jgi:hypothetical protein
MKLLTHNMLSCHIKGVKSGFPFKIEPEKVEQIDADYDPDFLRHIYPRLEWKALREAAAILGEIINPTSCSMPGEQVAALLTLQAPETQPVTQAFIQKCTMAQDMHGNMQA